MSIALTALQYLTMLVLRDVSIIGGNVLDNPLDPFPEDTILKPTVAVYIGTDTRDDVDRYGLFGAQHKVELSIQTFLPASLTITKPGGEKIKLSARGNGLQFVLGQIGGEIDLALTSSDSEAAQLWRVLIGGSPKKVTTTPWLMEVKRTSGAVRVPAVERLFDVETLADPLFAPDDIPEFWERVLALFEADDEYAEVGSLIRTLATGLGDLPQWRVAQAQLGLTEEGVAAIGVKPFEDHPVDDETDAAGMVEITLDPLGLTVDDALPPED
ncbi:MAG: hypothetical protein DI527_00730 [Chelatococcus sp.]|nr:MAG: hypothetical protein DI527_00730 [Chelatococcus sp.]